MRPQGRDVLIELFEREFLDPLERGGARVAGTYRDLDDPDRFVWFRGFADHGVRLRSLTDFYSSDLWLRNREAANATIVDNDDVLLLRPVSGRLIDPESEAPSATDPEGPKGLIVLETFLLPPGRHDDFAEFFVREIDPTLRELEAPPFATLATDPRQNDYPRLPVRENESVFVTATRFEDTASHAAFLRSLAATARWRDAIAAELARRTIAPPQLMRLDPTKRSALR
jgi:hypothetical protein